MTKKTSSKESKPSTEKLIKDIRRSTAKVYSSEQKILIVMEGMRAELSIAELCRKYGLSQPSITNGTKSSLKPARSACQEMKQGRLLPARSRSFVKRTAF